MIEVFPAPRNPVKTVMGIGVSFDMSRGDFVLILKG